MAVNKQDFNQLIREFKFRELFNEMGWDRDNVSSPIAVDDQTYTLQSVGQKSGFKILVCDPGDNGRIPDYSSRKKIESKVTKLFQEHLIIFKNAARTEQLWQFVARQTGKPTRITETRWNTNQEPELLFQRASGVFFELDEEDNITIVDVTRRIAENFDQNNERVTKKFYERFKAEHKTFSGFLAGIDDHIEEWNRTNPKKEDQKENLNKQWYVSLMLNRLMFCYFIQKKGFLDKNKNYLRDKLTECQARGGENQYHSFYRNFLLALFHEGLGTPEHSNELTAEIGRIPYLNGGLFDEHELERLFENIEIEDKAFENVFDFFDQYEWHLDTRFAASGKDVNPDVIGYIFEKYINDRAQMGAYYTKEDITDYISKNCILPFLFDETKRNYPKAFAADGEIWSMLRASGDGYVYDAVKKGVELELPENIAVGLDTTEPDLLERRKDWNKPAPVAYALPTEIWREVVDRRRRYTEAKTKIESGEITEINEFITYNLNIRQFIQEVVENTNDSKFLEHFYKALNSVTILDPTCGSGAFLFAAMNILEPLYESCLQRMRNFIEDEDRTNLADQKTFGHRVSYFREVLEEVQNPSHPNLRYFIYKSIILRNLYGVDIMNEAVEVAKLRLFLKLVATVDADYRKPNLGLEPLPDIDFNIRAGNTLVGFANEAELDDALLGTVQGAIAKPIIDERMEMVSRVFTRFKQSQVTTTDYRTIKEDKTELYNRLDDLNDELSRLCHEHSSSVDFNVWVVSHQPFHWLAEFYEIVHDRGGFDVIIGNPPFAEVPKYYGRQQFLKIYKTALEKWSRDEDVYTLVVERSLKLLRANQGKFGMILPLSITFSTKKPFVLLRHHIMTVHGHWWWSHFDRIPSSLFGNEVRTRCTISLLSLSAENEGWRGATTSMRRWEAERRENLFTLLNYARIDFDLSGGIPKVDNQVQADALSNLFATKRQLSENLTDSISYEYLAKIAPNFPISSVYIGGTAYNWFPAWRDIPETIGLNGEPSLPARTAGYRYIDEDHANIVFALLCSSLGYWWWAVASDGFNLKKWLLERFPVSLALLSPAAKKEIALLGERLRQRLKENYVYKDNKGKIGNYFLPACDAEIKSIDEALARHIDVLSETFFLDIQAFNKQFSRAKLD